MPKRTDIESILIIGAGPIIIGQACEFDYSGAQACKALKEEGYRVILVNSNPATIMTDPEMADSIYIEPINWRTLARIIEKEASDKTGFSAYAVGSDMNDPVTRAIHELIDHGMHTDQRIDQILEHLKRLGADCEDARKRDAFNANVLNKMVD